MTRSESVRRAGIENKPSSAEMDNIYYTAQQLDTKLLSASIIGWE
ncbi:hypothetical protein NEIFLAOT_01369 [Neisseria flavescens NRL30031/H210]|uniref:Uncharacterized protein n=1 Tax=Neisseria flavescens NRL30031/H210 TaxID=546264 RepID=C0EN36_NEIFL|nr:hypothetical protein NEIFLAOT_01369 [Neisseria flavescens NRL30031/H210]